MANVIPEEMRHNVERRERARLIITAAVVAIVCAGLAFVLLLPGYLATLVDARHAPPAFTAVTQEQQASDAAAIAHTNALLAVVAPIAQASSTPSDVILDALAARPSGVHIDQIIYRAGDPSSIMLSGSADTNNEINAYQTALSNDPHFASVSVPVGALVGTEGGHFSITLSGTF